MSWEQDRIFCHAIINLQQSARNNVFGLNSNLRGIWITYIQKADTSDVKLKGFTIVWLNEWMNEWVYFGLPILQK